MKDYGQNMGLFDPAKKLAEGIVMRLRVVKSRTWKMRQVIWLLLDVYLLTLKFFELLEKQRTRAGNEVQFDRRSFEGSYKTQKVLAH